MTVTVPHPRQPGDDMPSGGGSAHPPDITIGELWRTQQTILSSLDALTATIHVLPDRVCTDIDARYAERFTSGIAQSEEIHRQLSARMDKLEAWKEAQSPVIVRIDDRVSALQKVIWSAASLILSGDVAALFAFLMHK